MRMKVVSIAVAISLGGAGLVDAGHMRVASIAWGNLNPAANAEATRLLHLVGNVHQPLHSTAYFSQALTKKWVDQGKPDGGDRGGNEITVFPADGESTKLHFFWHGIFGGYSTVYGTIGTTRPTTFPSLRTPRCRSPIRLSGLTKAMLGPSSSHMRGQRRSLAINQSY